jgi:basic membrane lipoprotein Med (substrate-binding protein (PBP1-ABC) superfamily)
MAPKRNPRGILLLAAATCALLAVAIAIWTFWPAPARTPHARRYLDVSACLLTSPSGIVPGTPAGPLWASMESASLATHVMVSYLPDTGPADVEPMLNTLAERRCGVIVITASADPGQVISVAKANPDQQFLLVSSTYSGQPAPRNAAVVTPASAPARITQAIRALAATA